MKTLFYILLLILFVEIVVSLYQFRIIEFYNISKIDWGAISAWIVAGTLLFVCIQTKISEKIAAQQMIPAVEMNMIYDSDPRIKKTYLWFQNYSNVPAHVLMKIKFTCQKEIFPIGPYRIPPQTKDKPTASTFFDKSEAILDEYHKEGVRAIISVQVKPDIDNAPADAKVYFKKRYKFHDNKWDEEMWGWPDPPSPLYIANKNLFFNG